jgi:hypothetical protein
MRERFPLGRLVATPGALRAIAANDTSAFPFLARHGAGDWGDLCPEDVQANARALEQGTRLLSAYHLADGTKLWIITEADRSSTCLLLPEEY